MKGHFIGTNIRSVQDIINYTAKNNLDYLVLFLDLKKAFDLVSHHFLMKLLQKVGLPDQYIEWIEIIYSGAISVVRHKN